MGIDAWGWDRPLHLQAEEASHRAAGIFWAAHQADLAYCQIERLASLDQLPPTGFTVACFPFRLIGGSAAPARVVASSTTRANRPRVARDVARRSADAHGQVICEWGSRMSTQLPEHLQVS